jgi:hypothetical protein
VKMKFISSTSPFLWVIPLAVLCLLVLVWARRLPQREDLASREAAFAAREAAELARIRPAVEVAFQVKVPPEEIDDHEDGFCEWVDLADPEPDIGRMSDPDELVLPGGEYLLVIDYPVANPVEIPVKPEDPRGYTRAGIVREVSRAYRRLYEEEEETSTVKVIPPEARKGTFNRNETDGKHGIWGHDLRDLAVVKVWLEERDGKRRLRLVIYS